MKKAFDGFSSDSVIMILGLLILTAALERTGVVDIVGRAVLSRAEPSPGRLLWTVMIVSAVLGAFMSNTASTAFFLPIVFGIARKVGVSVSKLLMPMAFASILTSSVTLVSTSTNMIVSWMMTDHNMAPMGMFELAPVGLPIAVVGLIYLYFARRWIPDHGSEDELTEQFGVRPYLSEVVILKDSSLAGKTLAEARIGEIHGLAVLAVHRDNKRLTPNHGRKLQEGDLLLVEGSQEDLVKIKDTAGLEIKADAHLSDRNLTLGKEGLAEAIIQCHRRFGKEFRQGEDRRPLPLPDSQRTAGQNISPAPHPLRKRQQRIPPDSFPAGAHPRLGEERRHEPRGRRNHALPVHPPGKGADMPGPAPPRLKGEVLPVLEQFRFSRRKLSATHMRWSLIVPSSRPARSSRKTAK